MTGDPSALAGPLGRRLLAAFVLVALSSVLVLTVAALIATDRGLASVARQDRQRIAALVAAAAADAYARSGGWNGADLAPASAVAAVADARLVVRDVDGSMVWPGRGMGPSMGGRRGEDSTEPLVEQPIDVGGQRVGSVRLAFPASAPTGRTVAWSWVVGAAGAALLAELVASAFVSGRLARPFVGSGRDGAPVRRR